MRSAFSESLPCELTASELDKKSQEIAEEVRTHGQLEAAKKHATKHYADQIKASDEKIAKLAVEIRERTEYRQIPCTELVDPRDPTQVLVRRLDIGEDFRRRPLTAEEKQGRLFDAPVVTIAEARKRREAGVPDNDNDDDENTTH